MSRDVTKVWSVPHLNGLHLLSATFVDYVFKKHAHDYFVIGMVEEGVQRFAYGRQQYITPPSGVIVLNPGEVHDGEAAIPAGFRYRALYPETEVLQQVASQITERQQPIPFFREPVFHDETLFEAVRQLHLTLESTVIPLEQESRYLWVLAQLIQRYGDLSGRGIFREKAPVQQIRRYIEEHYAENIRLADLAALVHWNPFYLLQVFKQEVGLPPHSYLESVRIREAQRQLQQGIPLAEIAYAVGFSSQSHFTTVFKRVIGVTPGRYTLSLGS